MYAPSHVPSVSLILMWETNGDKWNEWDFTEHKCSSVIICYIWSLIHLRQWDNSLCAVLGTNMLQYGRGNHVVRHNLHQRDHLVIKNSKSKPKWSRYQQVLRLIYGYIDKWRTKQTGSSHQPVLQMRHRWTETETIEEWNIVESCSICSHSFEVYY